MNNMSTQQKQIFAPEWVTQCAKEQVLPFVEATHVHLDAILRSAPALAPNEKDHSCKRVVAVTNSKFISNMKRLGGETWARLAAKLKARTTNSS